MLCSIFSELYNHHQGYVLKLILEGREGREGRGERERHWCERNMVQLSPVCTLTRDQTRNLGLCPDPGSNPKPFSVLDDASTNCPTQPGPGLRSLYTSSCTLLLPLNGGLLLVPQHMRCLLIPFFTDAWTGLHLYRCSPIYLASPWLMVL